MSVHVTDERTVAELTERHVALYDGPDVEGRLRSLIREAPQSKLSDWDIHRILRAARAVFFDTHVEVVSGHHTATYLRFASIAKVPQLMRLIERDIADWIRQTYKRDHVDGIIATASEAELLAGGIADLLHREMRLRVVLTPFDRTTGKIGTDIMTGVIRPGERFVVLNDVTTRGNCVSKLSQVVTDQGGIPAGMMVFARRDSGQFPLMADLTAKFPFYWTADLDMPQWEPAACPLCVNKQPLLSWKEMPEL
jgi:orotate phosphoribosyltransferase